MTEKWKRALRYALTRLGILALVVALVMGAFFSSMKTSNVYFLLGEALRVRLNSILLGDELDTSAHFFSYDYLNGLENDMLYQEQKQRYSLYTITNYSSKFQYKNLFVWPWQRTKTVTVREAVMTINGEYTSVEMTEEEAKKYKMYEIPEWTDSIYEVRLVYRDGAWKIDKIERVGEFEYEPVATPALSQEQIEALRTPTPAPTATPKPGEVISGDRMATITTALSGEKVNLREGPASAYKILGELNRGDRVTVKEESDGWYRVVTAAGQEGYVSGYFILFD